MKFILAKTCIFQFLMAVYNTGHSLVMLSLHSTQKLQNGHPDVAEQKLPPSIKPNRNAFSTWTKDMEFVEEQIDEDAYDAEVFHSQGQESGPFYPPLGAVEILRVTHTK